MRLFIRIILGVSILIGIIVTALLIINKVEIYSPKRDIIAFRDSVEVVQASINDIVKLMNKTSPSEVKNYWFSHGNLFINKVKIRNQESFTIKEKSDFEELANTLKNNFISSSYQDRATGFWMFIYRELWDPSFDDGRNIVYLNNIQDTILLKPEYYVLDIKKNLFLLAPTGDSRY